MFSSLKWRQLKEEREYLISIGYHHHTYDDDFKYSFTALKRDYMSSPLYYVCFCVLFLFIHFSLNPTLFSAGSSTNEFANHFQTADNSWITILSYCSLSYIQDEFKCSRRNFKFPFSSRLLLTLCLHYSHLFYLPTVNHNRFEVMIRWMIENFSELISTTGLIPFKKTGFFLERRSTGGTIYQVFYTFRSMLDSRLLRTSSSCSSPFPISTVTWLLSVCVCLAVFCFFIIVVADDRGDQRRLFEINVHLESYVASTRKMKRDLNIEIYLLKFLLVCYAVASHRRDWCSAAIFKVFCVFSSHSRSLSLSLTHHHPSIHPF